MHRNELLRSGIAAAFTALAATALAGCGGWVQPGDYQIYKVEVAKASKGNGCFFDGPDPNTVSDSDTTLGDQTWVFTADTSGNFFLDLGDESIQGKKTDAGFSFDGKTVDVEFENDDPTMTKTTTTVDTRIDFTVDGKSIGGTVTTTSSFACVGDHCAQQLPNCVITSKFSGTRVDDVQLQYPVK
jgi:hypothetical protein